MLAGAFLRFRAIALLTSLGEQGVLTSSRHRGGAATHRVSDDTMVVIAQGKRAGPAQLLQFLAVLGMSGLPSLC
jgi:hypothetical protein